MNELVKSARDGNQVAFFEIANKYKPLLEATAEKLGVSFGCSEDDLEDLKQEALIALYSAVMTYDNEQDKVTFGLYAKVCVRNRIISALRKHHKKSRINDTPPAATESGPEQMFIEKEDYEKLLNIIDETLTSYEKSIFNLYLQEKSYREIAEALGKTEKSVDNAICRIKAKLKKRV